MLLWFLGGVGLTIILGLSVYAGILLRKVKEQKQTVDKAVKKRNEKILESVRYIARAMVEEQCNLSEGSIRLSVLLAELKLQEAFVPEQKFAALHELYDKVKDMPTHEARKEHSKKAIRELDRERASHEQRLNDAIIEEMKRLSDWHPQT